MKHLCISACSLICALILSLSCAKNNSVTTPRLFDVDEKQETSKHYEELDEQTQGNHNVVSNLNVDVESYELKGRVHWRNTPNETPLMKHPKFNLKRPLL